MTFESHKIVKEYINELAKITDARETLRTKLAETWETIYETEDDKQRYALTKTANDLEQQVNALTAKGERYMRKVDQLNGVR